MHDGTLGCCRHPATESRSHQRGAPVILRLLQLLPESLLEWLGVAVLVGLLCAGAFGIGWLEGRDGQRELTAAVTRQLTQTQRALDMSKSRAAGLADALAASQDNGADLMRRLLAAEQLACPPAATVDAPLTSGAGGRADQTGWPKGLPDQTARPLDPDGQGAAPVAPAAPRAGGDRAFTEALNAW